MIPVCFRFICCSLLLFYLLPFLPFSFFFLHWASPASLCVCMSEGLLCISLSLSGANILACAQIAADALWWAARQPTLKVTVDVASLAAAAAVHFLWHDQVLLAAAKSNQFNSHIDTITMHFYCQRPPVCPWFNLIANFKTFIFYFFSDSDSLQAVSFSSRLVDSLYCFTAANGVNVAANGWQWIDWIASCLCVCVNRGATHFGDRLILQPSVANVCVLLLQQQRTIETCLFA